MATWASISFCAQADVVKPVHRQRFSVNQKTFVFDTNLPLLPTAITVNGDAQGYERRRHYYQLDQGAALSYEIGHLSTFN